MPAYVPVAAVPAPGPVEPDGAIAAPAVPAGAVPADPAVAVEDRPDHDGTVDGVRSAVPVIAAVAAEPASIASLRGAGSRCNRSQCQGCRANKLESHLHLLYCDGLETSTPAGGLQASTLEYVANCIWLRKLTLSLPARQCQRLILRPSRTRSADIRGPATARAWPSA